MKRILPLFVVVMALAMVAGCCCSKGERRGSENFNVELNASLQRPQTQVIRAEPPCQAPTQVIRVQQPAPPPPQVVVVLEQQPCPPAQVTVVQQRVEYYQQVPQVILGGSYQVIRPRYDRELPCPPPCPPQGLRQGQFYNGQPYYGR
jgi:hypothetical protein